MRARMYVFKRELIACVQEGKKTTFSCVCARVHADVSEIGTRVRMRVCACVCARVSAPAQCSCWRTPAVVHDGPRGIRSVGQRHTLCSRASHAANKPETAKASCGCTAAVPSRCAGRAFPRPRSTKLGSTIEITFLYAVCVHACLSAYVCVCVCARSRARVMGVEARAPTNRAAGLRVVRGRKTPACFDL